MSDPFAPNSKDQLVREAQRGLVVVAVLLAIFFYVAFDRISGRNKELPEHIRNAPIARTVWPYSEDSPHASERRMDREQEQNNRFAQNTTDRRPRSKATDPAGELTPLQSDLVGDTAKGEPKVFSFSTSRESETSAAKGTDWSLDSGGPNSISLVSVIEEKNLDSIDTKRVDAMPQASTNNTIEPVGKLDMETFDPLPISEEPFRHELNNANSLVCDDAESDDRQLENLAENNVKAATESNSENSRLADSASENSFPSNQQASFEEPAPSADAATNFLAPDFNLSEQKLAVYQTESIESSPSPQLVAPKAELRPSSSRFAGSSSQQSTENLVNSSPPAPSGVRSLNELPTNHSLAEGESFYSIAQDYYGDGKYFRALYQHNADRIREYDTLLPGTLIVVPTLQDLQNRFPEEVSGLTEPPTTGTWAISANPKSVIDGKTDVSANSLFREKTFSSSSGPHSPGPNTSAEKMDSDRFHTPTKTYTTQGGETLFEIAARQLGQASRYLEILKLNRVRLGKAVNESTRLPANLLLILPDSSNR